VLRGEVRIERAVVVGDGPWAAPLLEALAAASFCGKVSHLASISELCEADLVVIDGPPGDTAELVRGALDRVAPGTLVTELCPIKSSLLNALEADVPPGYGFVACTVFPATAGSLGRAVVSITPLMGSVPRALERMRGLWEQLGAARVVQVDPGAQDLWVAARQMGTPDARRVAEGAAGADTLGGNPPGIDSAGARALNRDYLDWLAHHIEQARPNLP